MRQLETYILKIARYNFCLKKVESLQYLSDYST